jgi:hypothetical protein
MMPSEGEIEAAADALNDAWDTLDDDGYRSLAKLALTAAERVRWQPPPETDLIRELRGGRTGHVNALRMTDVVEIARLQSLCLRAADEIEKLQPLPSPPESKSK